jgi:hypothetical protein
MYLKTGTYSKTISKTARYLKTEAEIFLKKVTLKSSSDSKQYLVSDTRFSGAES